MSLLALDLGSRTGSAWSEFGSKPYCEAVTLKPKRRKKNEEEISDAALFAAFRVYLDNFVDTHGQPAEIVYEEVPAGATRGRQTVIVFGLRGVLLAWAWRLKIPCRGVYPGEWKLAAVDKGNATKAEVMAAMVKLGHAPPTEDAADALAILISQKKVRGKAHVKAARRKKPRAVPGRPRGKRRSSRTRRRAA